MAEIQHPVTSPLSFKTAAVRAAVEVQSDTDEQTPQVGEITFLPSTQTNAWTGVGGNVVSDQSIATWAFTLGLIQDVAEGGVLRWLLEHEGKKCVFTCVLLTGVTATITATLSPAQIGGPVQAGYLTSTVTLAADGRPVFS